MKSLFLKYLGDNPHMRVLQHFIEGRDFDYTLTDLLHAGVSWGTLNNLIPQLLKLELILKTRKIGRATLYKLNLSHPVIQHLVLLYDTILSKKLEDLHLKKVFSK